jgi:hypothetical protein
MPGVAIKYLPDGGYQVVESGCATVMRHPGDSEPGGFWAGLNAGNASVAYAFSRPLKWLAGTDLGASNYYNQAWAASGIQGTSAQKWTDFFAGASAVTGYAAALVWGWGAMGLPTLDVGMSGTNLQNVHFFYQVTGSSWLQGVTGGSIIGAGYSAPTWVPLGGIPIFFPTAAASLQYAWSTEYPCVSAVVQALIAGWTQITIGGR